METPATWQNLKPGTKVKIVYKGSHRCGELAVVEYAKPDSFDPEMGDIRVRYCSNNQVVDWGMLTSLVVIDGPSTTECDPFNGGIKL